MSTEPPQSPSATNLWPLFASCGRGMETLLARELASLGASAIRETSAGVYCEADSAGLYRIGYCARLPSRWLLRLGETEMQQPEALYELARSVPWEQHFGVADRFAIHIAGKSSLFRDSRFALLRVKDAIADRFRELQGERPSVDSDKPDVLVNLALRGSRAALSLDLVGAALHERGYRSGEHAAPIKENLAAAVLTRAGWAPQPDADLALVDPFCGGATMLIEGLWMAAGVPAQWLRSQFAWERWRGHQSEIWAELRRQIDATARANLAAMRVRAYGSDQDKQAIIQARRQLQAAGMAGFARLETGDATLLRRPAGHSDGLVLANLPYGERLGLERELMPIHRGFGDALKRDFAGWRFALLCGNETLARATGLRADKVQKVYNGPLECVLILGGVAAATVVAADAPTRFRSAGAEMVYNRILKNRKRLKRWLEREGIDCYRIYDADLPEYAAAIDVYQDRLHIQEYAAPSEIPKDKAQQRLDDLVYAARRAFDLPPEKVYLKQRRAQSPEDQYRKHDHRGEFFTVEEGGLHFEVNLADYLDSGLFLDGRQIRSWIAEGARGARLLNLFCYTGSATVAAVHGGARSSVSVDLSPTYLAWAQRNFALNRVDTRVHRLLREDVLTWLPHCDQHFDLIYVDPPSFSNSKRTPTVFDVQRDHAGLLRRCLELLAPQGRILFVCNLRRFKLAPELVELAEIQDVTEASIPPDFARDQRIHHAFWLRRKPQQT